MGAPVGGWKSGQKKLEETYRGQEKKGKGARSPPVRTMVRRSAVKTKTTYHSKY